MTALAPDYFEPVVGWRTWLVVEKDGALVLRSVAFETVWEPRRELTAACRARRRRALFRRRATEHRTPSARCECGIHAARDVEAVVGYLTAYDDLFGRRIVHRVIGRVRLWGLVVEGELGWRAEHAYPEHIYVPPHGTSGRVVEPTAIACALGAYGVPVELLGDRGAGALSLGEVARRLAS